MFDVEVEYLPDGGSEWEQTEGKLYGVDTYVITRKPKQEKMVPCFGDNALTLFLTSKCSLAKHVQQLAKVQDHKTGCVSSPTQSLCQHCIGNLTHESACLSFYLPLPYANICICKRSVYLFSSLSLIWNMCLAPFIICLHVCLTMCQTINLFA